MRNLKKVLSLSLAFLMLLGFMSFASAKEFPDTVGCTDEQREAIDVLSNLGIIKGVNDTDFQPDGGITRAAFAKMLYVSANKGVDDNAFRHKEATNPFSDISAEGWEYGYTCWALRMGYISGSGINPDNGLINFKPADNVKLVEALKMILGLLGYDKNQLGFDGSGWMTNIVYYATEAGIIPESFNAPEDRVENLDDLTRAEAAVLLYTGLKADTVVTTNGNVIPSGKDYLVDKMGLTRTQGTVIANDFFYLDADYAADEGTTVLFIANEDGDDSFEGKAGDIKVVPTVSGQDELGRDAYAYTKIQSGKVVSVGTVQVSELTLVSTTYNETKNVGNTAVQAYYNYTQLDKVTCAVAADGAGTLTKKFPNVENVQYIVNASGKVLRAFSDQWLYGTVTAKGASKKSLTIKGYWAGDNATFVEIAEKADEITEGYADIGLNDKVFVYLLGGDDATAIKVEKIETITGKATRYHSNGYVLVNGTELYKSPSKTVTPAAVINNTLIGAEKVYSLDHAGKVLDIYTPERKAGEPLNYMVAVSDGVITTPVFDPETGETTYTYYVRALLDDGKAAKSYIAVSHNGDVIEGPDGIDFVAAGDVFAYTLDNGKLELTDLPETLAGISDDLKADNTITGMYAVKNAAVAKSTGWLTGTVSERVGDDNVDVPVEKIVSASSKFFVKNTVGENVTWSFIKGRPATNLKTMEDTTATIYLNKTAKDSDTVVLGVFNNAVPSSTTTAKTLWLLVADTNLNIDDKGKYYVEFPCINITDDKIGTIESIHTTKNDALAIVDAVNIPGAYRAATANLNEAGQIESWVKVEDSPFTGIADNMAEPLEGLYFTYLTRDLGANLFGVRSIGYGETEAVLQLDDEVKIYDCAGWVNGTKITAAELTLYPEAPDFNGQWRSKHAILIGEEGKIISILQISTDGQYC